MAKRTKLIIAAVVVVVLAAGVGVWALFLREDAAPEFTLGDERTTSTTAPDPGGSSTTGSGQDDGGSGTDAGGSPIDGNWEAASGPDTQAGYRIEEVLAGLNKTATARTPGVAAALKITDARVVSTEVTVDMTGLVSTDDTPGTERRDAYVQGIALETATFAQSSFELAEPIDLGSVEQGKRLTFDAVGDLTLHGVIKRVTVPLEARWNQDDTIDVVGSLEILLPDYKITPPDLGFVKVAERGTFEFKLRLERVGTAG